MEFLWPWFLPLLGLIPLLIAAYIWALRRRRKFVVRFSSLSLVREAAQKQSRWRRHVPVALFLGGVSSLSLALARPVAIVSIPTNETTIILAMDVSRSMCSTDIPPNRLRAAQDAALSFIQNQKSGTHFGIVAFAGFAELIQPPTTDQEVLNDAIESLITGRRTAIGESILKSIDAIAEVDKSVAPSTRGSEDGPQPVIKGAYAPEIIVLLTDGASNAGVQPVDAAQQAADRGIRVYTIGFGTERGGERPNCSASLIGGEPVGPAAGGRPSEQGGGFGGGFGGGGGGGFRRGIDEATLKKVAEITDAEYYSAESASQLVEVFEQLPTNLITRHETTEISFAFAAAGALLAALAVGLSLLWNPLS
jgi:Ca-activated chloride channel family protein